VELYCKGSQAEGAWPLVCAVIVILTSLYLYDHTGYKAKTRATRLKAHHGPWCVHCARSGDALWLGEQAARLP
jgi:hypothetical protein